MRVLKKSIFYGNSPKFASFTEFFFTVTGRNVASLIAVKLIMNDNLNGLMAQTTD